MRLIMLLPLLLTCLAKKPKYRYDDYEQSVPIHQLDYSADDILAKQPAPNAKQPVLNVSVVNKLLQGLQNAQDTNSKLRSHLVDILDGDVFRSSSQKPASVPNTSALGSKNTPNNEEPILEASEDADDSDEDFDFRVTRVLKLICNIKLQAGLVIKNVNGLESLILSALGADDDRVIKYIKNRQAT